jgi:hypothetical protein
MASARGQANVEYVGLVALLALALAAFVAVGPPPISGLPRAIAASILPEDGAVAAETPAAESRLELVERLMADDLGSFLAYRASAERDGRLDFSTDECSAPVVGSTGRTFDFTQACLRHDFGYRNYGRLGLLDDRRRDVDERFLADMRAHCASRPSDDLLPCLGWARDFHTAVRAFGWIPASRYE